MTRPFCFEPLSVWITRKYQRHCLHFTQCGAKTTWHSTFNSRNAVSSDFSTILYILHHRQYDAAFSCTFFFFFWFSWSCENCESGGKAFLSLFFRHQWQLLVFLFNKSLHRSICSLLSYIHRATVHRFREPQSNNPTVRKIETSCCSPASFQTETLFSIFLFNVKKNKKNKLSEKQTEKQRSIPREQEKEAGVHKWRK